MFHIVRQDKNIMPWCTKGAQNHVNPFSGGLQPNMQRGIAALATSWKWEDTGLALCRKFLIPELVTGCSRMLHWGSWWYLNALSTPHHTTPHPPEKTSNSGHPLSNEKLSLAPFFFLSRETVYFQTLFHSIEWSLGEQTRLWINYDISKYCCTKLWWASVENIQDFPDFGSNNIERGSGKLNNTPIKKDWSTPLQNVLCSFSFSFCINFCWTHCFSRKMFNFHQICVSWRKNVPLKNFHLLVVSFPLDRHCP